MKKGKIIILVVVVVFVAIQFFRPDRNISGRVSKQCIAQCYHIPDSVNHILQQACMNCHSNNTDYPWYADVQPFGWWLNHHIHEGKSDLNFDEFALCSTRQRINKFRSMKDQIKDGEMPLWSYTLMHKEARLSKTEKTTLIHWLDTTMDSLKTIERKKYSEL